MTDEAQEFTEVEQEAMSMGWLPQDQFKGRPENWRPAEEYLERGKSLLPLVRKENETLKNELGTVKGELAEVKNLLKAQSESTTALVEASNEAALIRLKEEQKALRTQLVEARREGLSAEDEVAIQEQLDAVTEKIRTGNTKGVTRQPPPPADLTPEMKDFLKENGDWFGVDKERTGHAMAYGEKLKAENPSWTPAQIYAAVAKRNKEIFAPQQTRTRAAPKVESGGSGGGTGDSGGGEDNQGETYSDLPAEAKAACERMTTKVVGKGRKFATKKEYQAWYARDYFRPQTMQDAATGSKR